MGDVGGEHLRLVLAFRRRAPMQLRSARQDLINDLAGRIEQYEVADRQWSLLVGLLLKQLACQRQLPAFAVDLDLADLRVDA